MPWPADNDDALFGLIDSEVERQNTTLQLIASENFTSMPVMEALGSCMTNKYSEVRDKDFQNRKENKKSKISKKKLLRRRPL